MGHVVFDNTLLYFTHEIAYVFTMMNHYMSDLNFLDTHIKANRTRV
jgi:hypothetical protein